MTMSARQPSCIQATEVGFGVHSMTDTDSGNVDRGFTSEAR